MSRQTRNSNNRHHNQTHQENDGFFDLKLTGIAYVNRLEEKKSQQGDFFTTCSLAVLIGPKNTEKRQYRFIDVVVIGKKTLDLLWQYEHDLADKHNVMIKFCLSDIQASAFKRDDASLGANLRSKLYAIEKVWVDNELTYESPKPKDEQTPVSSESRKSSQPTGNRSSNTRNSPRQSGRSTRAA